MKRGGARCVAAPGAVGGRRLVARAQAAAARDWRRLGRVSGAARTGELHRRHHGRGCLRPRAVSQGIFDAVLQVVRRRAASSCSITRCCGAEAERPQRRMSAELSDALLAQRRALPDLKVLFITDPANEHYGAAPSPELQLLRAGGRRRGADGSRSRCAIPTSPYSSLWRLALRWWDTPAGPFGVATRRLNFKADAPQGRDRGRRRAADSPRWSARPTPPMPRAPGRTSARACRAAALAALLASELAVARFSGWRERAEPYSPAPAAASAAGAGLRCRRRRASRRQAAPRAGAHRGRDPRRAPRAPGRDARAATRSMWPCSIWPSSGVSEALLAAARRGVGVRLILDPNAERDQPTAPACPISRWRASWWRAAAARSTCAGIAPTASAFTTRW